MRITYLPKPDKNRASSRYRQIIPGKELTKRGVEINATGKNYSSDWLVVNKAVGFDIRHMTKGPYRKICFDMCDNHFITEHRDIHMEAVRLADLVTCSTQTMADEINKHTKKKAVVIEDPYELNVAYDQPEHDKTEMPTICWHGNNLSVPPLLNQSEILFSDHGVQIRIGGHVYDFYAVGADNYNWCASYSVQNTSKAMTVSDICIIPTMIDDWYKCKSPNRLVNAAQMGLFVIANPMPAYEPFKEWMCVGDIAEGLDFYNNSTGDEICQRVRRSQLYIQENHSPKKIGEKWLKTLFG